MMLLRQGSLIYTLRVKAAPTLNVGITMDKMYRLKVTYRR